MLQPAAIPSAPPAPALVPSVTPSAAAPVGASHGRTAWDFLAENTGASVTFFIVAFLALVVLSFVVFAFVMYRRAAREKCQFALVPPQIGPRLAELQAPRPGSAGATSIAATEQLLRAALEIARAAEQIRTATDPSAVADQEGYLLSILVEHTTQRRGMKRRASMLEIGSDAATGFFMAVREGYPEPLFQKPHKTFSRGEYLKHHKGMCWAAVDACTRATNGPARYVMRVPNVKAEPTYVEVVGHHVFESILIAPIIAEGPEGRSVLGVVCLDSDEKEHYGDVDAYLLALTAIELASVWKALGRPSMPLS